jgi:hypothetical protein
MLARKPLAAGLKAGEDMVNNRVVFNLGCLPLSLCLRAGLPVRPVLPFSLQNLLTPLLTHSSYLAPIYVDVVDG